MARLTLVTRTLVALFVIALALRVWRARRSNGPLLLAFGQREALLAVTMNVYIAANLVELVPGVAWLGEVIREWAWIAWGALFIGMVRLWRALRRR
jgi:hypothetical protein